VIAIESTVAIAISVRDTSASTPWRRLFGRLERTPSWKVSSGHCGASAKAAIALEAGIRVSAAADKGHDRHLTRPA
jgi:hypothetical protein